MANRLLHMHTCKNTLMILIFPHISDGDNDDDEDDEESDILVTLLLL